MAIRAELEDLKRQRYALESKIKTELRPQENGQQNTVNAYKSYFRIASGIALIETYATDFGNYLTALENEQKDDRTLEYHPKDYFGDDFVTTMSEYANSIHGAVVETFEKIEASGKRYGFLNDVK